MTTVPPTPPENPNGQEWLPVSLVHDWCPVDRRFPSSYWAAHQEDPALCVAIDPCLPDGSTLWMIQPCETSTIVAVGEPPVPSTLPATGSGLTLLLAAAAAVAIGWIVGLTARRPR